jgi:hypothetical protein
MAETAQLSEELTARIDQYLEDGETREEFVEELLNHYESEGNLLWEGYGGAP